jgi:hypothetical protein
MNNSQSEKVPLDSIKPMLSMNIPTADNNPIINSMLPPVTNIDFAGASGFPAEKMTKPPIYVSAKKSQMLNPDEVNLMKAIWSANNATPDRVPMMIKDTPTMRSMADTPPLLQNDVAMHPLDSQGQNG